MTKVDKYTAMGKTIRPRTRAAVCGKTCHCKGETCVNITPGTVQLVTFNNGVQKGGEGAMDRAHRYRGHPIRDGNQMVF